MERHNFKSFIHKKYPKKMEEVELKNGRTDLMTVLFRFLRMDPANARFDLGDIDELTESIKTNGVRRPVMGYKVKEDGVEYYYINDGSRRFEACRRLYEQGIEVKVPFQLESKHTTDQERAINRIISNEGKPYTPLELALEMKKLADWGWSNTEIAKRTSKKANYVRKLMLLANAPMALQNFIREGRVKGSLAIIALEKKMGDALIEQLKAGKAPTEDQFEKEEVEDQDQLILFNQEENSDKGISTPIPGGFTRNTTGHVVPQDHPSTKMPPKEKKTKEGLPTVTKSTFLTNSYSEFKKWAKLANPLGMTAESRKTFDFMCSMMNNELTPEKIAEFFTLQSDEGE
jgi:ParB/RepB/Spo0J family partition protein